MKILIIGHMAASKAGLTPLAALLREQNHKVFTFLPGGKDFTPEDETGITAVLEDGISALVTGMASQEAIARVELSAVRRAKELGVPVFCYADTFDTWNRPWFGEFLPSGTLFVLDENEAGKARKVFPNTTVVPTGNPEWDKYFFGEHPSREEVRSKLGLSAGAFVIHVPWGKSAPVNVLHLSGVFDAVREVQFPRAVHIIVTPHRGDQNPLSVYEDLRRFSPVPTSFVAKDTLTSSEVIGGVDLMVDSAGIGIEAVCRRFPLIDFFTPLALDRLENSINTRDWVPCKQGVSMQCLTSFHLRSCLFDLMQEFAPWIEMQHLKQKELYIAPAVQGEAVRKMAEAIQAKLA